jgi:hypothetical protein
LIDFDQIISFDRGLFVDSRRIYKQLFLETKREKQKHS